MPRYYRFQPVGYGAGVFTTPILGEVVVGRTYEVSDTDWPQFDDSPDWVRGSKADAARDLYGEESAADDA